MGPKPMICPTLLAEIISLHQRYTAAADSFDGTAFALCFTEDGTLDRPDGIYKGHKALTSLLNPTGSMKRRHFFMPPLLISQENGMISGTGYCLYFECEIESGRLNPPVPIDYQDTYHDTSEGWLIFHRKVGPAFPKNDHRPPIARS